MVALNGMVERKVLNSHNSDWSIEVMGDEKVAPNVSQRQDGPCEQLKQAYQNNCLPSWVKYFDKKRVYDEYKKKLQEKGYEPLPLGTDTKR